jgi:hypothetical protein
MERNNLPTWKVRRILLSVLETNGSLKMQNDDNKITPSEAQAALDSLVDIDRDTTISLRMPIWLNLITASAYGMMIFSWSSTRHENLWMLGFIISAVVFGLAVLLYLYRSRLLGMKPKILPKSKPELVFHALTGIFFLVIFILTRYLSESGMHLAPFIGGFIAGIGLALLLHYYPSGEFKKASKNK